MADEYKTTTARVLTPNAPPPPVPPDGKGWLLVSSAAATANGGSVQPITLFWFWHRNEPTRPCACGAMGRKNGKCLGCNKEVPRP